MPDAVGGDLPGQSHGDHLLIGGNEPPGMLGDPVQGVQTFLDDAQPPLVHLLVQDFVGLLQGGTAGLYHLEQILEIPVVFQRLSDLIHIF